MIIGRALFAIETHTDAQGSPDSPALLNRGGAASTMPARNREAGEVAERLTKRQDGRLGRAKARPKGERQGWRESMHWS